MHLTLSNIKHVYSLLKQQALKFYADGQYTHAWSAMCDAASLIQELNWEYTDDDLEQLLQQLSAQWLPNISTNYVGDDNRVVVLDDWCTTYVLVMQYIDALVAAGKEILYITSKDIDNCKYKHIIPIISKYPKLTYCVLPGNKQSIDAWCQTVYQKVIDFRPSKVIAHISSSSAFLPIISRVPQGLITYRSNLDDQCFWLGRSIIDYCLEFRPFGVAVSRERRKLRAEQQLYVPFYPIKDGNSFDGFPELPKDSVTLFSGGDFYKTLDPDYTYWNLVKRILQENPNAVLLYATKNILGKTKTFLESFIADNHLEKQFYYIGFRSDIYEVFAHCDIFLGTCPVCGSLTSQLASVNHKPILQYYLPGTDDDETEQSVCYNNPNLSISFTDKDAFLKEAKHLIDDKSYREQKGEEMYRAMMTTEQFNEVFIKAITTNIAPCPIKKVNYKEVLRRWLWPEYMGFDEHVTYLEPMLKRYGLLRRIPMLWVKYNYRRFITTKLFSIDWYKYKLHLS